MASVNTSVWNIIGSMRSIDKWSQAAQSNIGNATRVGYKSYEVNFGGGNSHTIMKNPSMTRAGTQIAEQLIQMAYTSINWRQGDLFKSQSTTDFAINGEGFFMLTQGPPVAGAKVYYTRDGQFHQDANGDLVNNNGLFYVTRANAIAMGLMAGGTSQHALALPDSLHSLRYSMFGSTIFEHVGASVTVNEPESSGLGEVKDGFLEASNVNTEKELLNLNESKTAYTVLAKQLTIFWQNFDVGLNLLK